VLFFTMGGATVLLGSSTVTGGGCDAHPKSRSIETANIARM